MSFKNGTDVTSSARRDQKSSQAFRTISEVAEELGLPQHVLRFWETKFHQVSPMKRGGGRRYYRPEDVELLRRIKVLLHKDGYTIKGVQKLLNGGGVKNLPDFDQVSDQDQDDAVSAAEPAQQLSEKPEGAPSGQGPNVRVLSTLIAELEDIRDTLKKSA